MRGLNVCMSSCSKIPNMPWGLRSSPGSLISSAKVFERNGKQEELLLGVYVKYFFISSSSKEAQFWFTSQLEVFVLSMQIRYDRNKGLLQFDQRFSITSLAVKYGVKDLQCRTMPITSEVDLPRLAVAEVNSNEYLSIIGSCLHISQVSRPDIA